ncbi:MAG: prolyl oligopeptidase family serine peptidase [Acidobacteriia bacterium]|nr:prolyl oligopeptidase family serine peptidase [Terriglobia bacterium]
MRNLCRLLLVSAALLRAADFTPPPTRADPVTEVLHGVTITDPYRWLENQNSPDTRAWLATQDKFARAYLDGIPGRDQLRKKFDALFKIDSVGAPTVRHGRYFFSRRLASEDRRSLAMRQGFAGKDEILVDPAKVSADATTSVQFSGISDDGGLIAYGIRRGGEDETEIHLLDVNTRQLLPDSLPRGRYFGFSIKPDKSGFYYSHFTVGQGARVCYHAMGGDPKADKLIFGEGRGAGEIVYVTTSDDGRWLLTGVIEGVPAKRTEIWVQDLAHQGPLVNIVKDEGEWNPDVAGDSMLLTTNWRAPNRRIYRVDLKNPARDRWKEIVPESKLAIGGSSAVGGRLFVSYLENVVTRIRQFDLDGKPLTDLPLPGIGTASVPSGRWSDDEAFFGFTSFVEPGAAYRISVATGKRDLWFRPKIPIQTENIEAKQVWYTSKDGTRVPMFVVHRKGLTLDGSHPTYLTGYGGFNAPSVPAFSSIAAWWAENGGVYAVANIRGGGEFGEAWHKAGMFERKQNVFDDFIAAAEWLIENKYTQRSRLAVEGYSNGGLLMGAMMTQRPDLFGAIICGAPLLDMLRFDKMSVGAWWTAEYGSAADPEQFKFLYKYSPYHNVKKGTKYPAVLFLSGDSDTRVDPAHARKMTALMQAANASANPIVLRYDIKGGHSGIANVSKTVEEQVDQIAFLADRLGMKIE